MVVSALKRLSNQKLSVVISIRICGRVTTLMYCRVVKMASNQLERVDDEN